MLDIESPLCLPSLTVGLLTRFGIATVDLCDWVKLLENLHRGEVEPSIAIAEN